MIKSVINNRNLETISSYVYELNNAGNRAAVTDISGKRTEYNYDDLNRLITETVITPQNETTITNYTYSDGGKLLTKQTETEITEHTYSTSGRLTMIQVKDLSDNLISQTEYQYDSNGNIISILKDGVETNQTYDFENRLKTVTNTGITTIYSYDGRGNRISKNNNGNITNYLIDESFIYPQIILEYDDLGTVTREYHRGVGLISMKQGTTEHFYHYDGLGSVRALSDGNNVTDTYDYDAYGELKTHTGTTENSYLYTGEQYDEETGNYYLRARYYDPSASQFISRDSWEGDTRNPITLNKYSYANSNPAMFTDPSGYFSIPGMFAVQAAGTELSKTAIPGISLIPSPSQIKEKDGVEMFMNRFFVAEIHAAWNVLFYTIDDSWKNRAEYGGWIVKHDFLYYAVEPYTESDPTGVTPDNFPKPKEGATGKITASYHTHVTPFGSATKFSRTDTDAFENDYPLYNHYMGNTIGEMWAFYKKNISSNYQGELTRFLIPPVATWDPSWDEYNKDGRCDK